MKPLTNLFSYIIIFFLIACISQNRKVSISEETDLQNDKLQNESSLPSDKKWKLVWYDEFDGNSLDTTKWSYRLDFWGRRHPSLTEEGASLDGKGNLLLKIYEKDGKYYSSTIQTGSMYFDPSVDREYGKWPIGKLEKPKFMHKYGYYEIRCKLSSPPTGWWAAFWLQSPIIGSSLDPGKSGVEIDILETFSDYGVLSGDTISHNCHWDGYGVDHKSSGLHAYALEKTKDGFHTFGVDWNPEGYVFYVDGKVSYRMNEVVSHTEQFILVHTECEGFRGDNPTPKPELLKAELPAYFIVDYVRVYDEIPD